jgi:type IV pilus assembly protein PilW
MSHAPNLHRPAHRRPQQRQAGFSLIELMVALTLGLLLVGGVISIFITNQQAFRTTAALGRVQENARISFELMARDVRQSGGNACGTPLVKNLLKSSAWSDDWDAGTVVGYTGVSGTPTIRAFGTASAERVVGTDAVKVLGSAIGTAAGFQLHNTATATIQLAAPNSGLKNDDLVMACDGISAVIAQISSITTTSGIDTLSFATTGTSPGNCANGFSYISTCTTPVIRAFSADGFVAPLSASFWYIGINSRGGKSLYRASANATPDEIAENVVNMQIAYLLRTEATGVLDANWVEASSVTDWKSNPSPVKKVAALRFTLQLETLEKVGTNQEVIQRELIHVVNLRNRPD